MSNIIKLILMSPLTAISEFNKINMSLNLKEVFNQVTINQIVIILLTAIVRLKTALLLTIGNFLYPAVIMAIQDRFEVHSYIDNIKSYYKGLVGGTPYQDIPMPRGRGPRKRNPQDINPNTNFQDLDRDFSNQQPRPQPQHQQQQPRPQPRPERQQPRPKPTIDLGDKEISPQAPNQAYKEFLGDLEENPGEEMDFLQDLEGIDLGTNGEEESEEFFKEFLSDEDLF